MTYTRIEEVAVAVELTVKHLPVNSLHLLISCQPVRLILYTWPQKLTFIYYSVLRITVYEYCTLCYKEYGETRGDAYILSPPGGSLKSTTVNTGR